MNYWKAADHRFDTGKIHVLDDCLQKTLCGESIGTISGQRVRAEGHNCGRCSRSLEAREKAQKRQEEADQKRQEWEKQSEERRAWYDQYLQSPAWRKRRALVLERANYMCEGCLLVPAVQVHHVNYDTVGDELLFDLRAVCIDCHEKCHPDRRAF